MVNTKGATPELKTKMAMFQRACVAQKDIVLQGNDILITEVVRDGVRQDALYAQGRTKPGDIVTYSTSKTGKHCVGKAFDIIFYKNKKAYYPPVKNKIWDAVAEIGKKCGLTPGRYFPGFQDSPHFEVA